MTRTLPISDLLAIAQVLQQAQADKAHKGRGTAYNTLLNSFHREVLPFFWQPLKAISPKQRDY